MKILYTTEAVVEGGRAARGRSSDGQLGVELSVPKELGGEGAHSLRTCWILRHRRFCSLILLGRDPDADVRGTVPKHDTLAGFAVAQVPHRDTVRENQVREVQNNGRASRLCVDKLAQLA
jgi:hypothetical protein